MVSMHKLYLFVTDSHKFTHFLNRLIIWVGIVLRASAEAAMRTGFGAVKMHKLAKLVSSEH